MPALVSLEVVDGGWWDKRGDERRVVQGVVMNEGLHDSQYEEVSIGSQSRYILAIDGKLQSYIVTRPTVKLKTPWILSFNFVYITISAFTSG
jgi:hypothetical protein